MDLVSLKHLANSGAPDEISNVSDGEGIESKVKMSGLTRDGKTKKAVLFVIYQTECHGPQNGFRLALVEECHAARRGGEVKGAYSAGCH